MKNRSGGPLNLANLDAAEMTRALAPLGIEGPLARRIFARVHRDGRLPLAEVEGLSLEKRARLEEALGGGREASAPSGVDLPRLQVLERRRADDGFVKYLFRLHDGPEIEAVRIPLPDPAEARALKERRRRGEAAALEALPTAKYTLCLSSQAGCALACDFCATGRLGGIRNLETWEILAQYHQVAAEADHPIRGIVFMGMGEPLLNYENVVRAARILSHPAGPAISAKAISISTAGVVPQIRRFTDEGHHFRLVVSLGAPNHEDRARLMPIENRWPLPELMEAVRGYQAKAGGRVMLAYVAIGGVNMSADHAEQVGRLVEGLPVRLSLIDVSDPTGQYHPPSEEQIHHFRDILSRYGVPVVRRYSGGKEIGAACGTLSASRQGGELVEVRRQRPDPKPATRAVDHGA